MVGGPWFCGFENGVFWLNKVTPPPGLNQNGNTQPLDEARSDSGLLHLRRACRRQSQVPVCQLFMYSTISGVSSSIETFIAVSFSLAISVSTSSGSRWILASSLPLFLTRYSTDSAWLRSEERRVGKDVERSV